MMNSCWISSFRFAWLSVTVNVHVFLWSFCAFFGSILICFSLPRQSVSLSWGHAWGVVLLLVIELQLQRRFLAYEKTRKHLLNNSFNKEYLRYVPLWTYALWTYSIWPLILVIMNNYYARVFSVFVTKFCWHLKKHLFNKEYVGQFGVTRPAQHKANSARLACPHWPLSWFQKNRNFLCFSIAWF